MFEGFVKNKKVGKVTLNKASASDSNKDHVKCFISKHLSKV